MTEHTREHPGCLCEMRRFLCEKTGLSPTQLIWLSGIHEIPKTPKGKWKYKPSQMAFFLQGDKTPYRPKNREMVKGGGEIQVLEYNDGEESGDIGVPWPPFYEKIAVLEYRRLKDYDVVWKNAGRYQDNLKGGWYVKIPLLEIEGHFFAPSMETSCCLITPHLYLDSQLLKV